jgi:two-component system, chemotaxis family, CheB/CheR fusion protein
MTARTEDEDPVSSPAGSPAAAGAPLSLIAIGASAGGIAALRSFFAEIPGDSGLTFVVVMHLSPEHESHLAEVLQPWVRMPVEQVRERTLMQPDRVYVIPPARSLSVTDGHVDVAEFRGEGSRRAPIDLLFRTVADRHPDGVGVLLSGSGADGAVGLRAIKEKGGLILAQSPDDAEYQGMPLAAVETGAVDFVLPARELGAKVVELRARGTLLKAPASVADLAEEDAGTLERIMAVLRARSGHDFSGYKTSTVLRRVGRRMQVTRSGTLSAYLSHLTDSGDEWEALLKDLLISVTSFFRDPEAWNTLAELVVPELLDRLGPDDTVRVWTPGCATGEEAYSVAMLLCEGAEARGIQPRIQIFATDLDRDAIATAREGLYSAAIAADVSEERLERFFGLEGSYYRVRRSLRDLVLFAEHDLLRDPPFSRLDLLCSRNVLIYLERDIQQRVIELFRYALRPGRFLFLGSSEGVEHEGGSFRPVHRAHRVFQRSDEGATFSRLPDLPLWAPRREPALPGRQQMGSRTHGIMHRAALERFAPPSVLVDRNHAIVHASETASRYLIYPAGTPTSNLLKVSHPQLRGELRALLHRVLDDRVPTRSEWVPLSFDGEPRQVQIVGSAADAGGRGPGALLFFLEAAPASASAEVETAMPPEGARQQLERAESALGNAHERIEDMMEQAHVREEELRSSNEELHSANEEYRSALEELETSKEELQSMNEELKTVNDELEGKVAELARSSNDLQHLVAATAIATLFVDRDLRIKRFTPALTDTFNILPTDVGRPLQHLTHSLDYGELVDDCEGVLRTFEPVEREVRSVNGRSFLARITPYRAEGEDATGVVATFTDISGIRRAQEAMEASERRFRVLVEATAQIVWTMDADGHVVRDSPSWRAFTGQSLEAWLDNRWSEMIHPDDLTETAERWAAAVVAREPIEAEFRLWHEAGNEWRTVRVRAVPVRDEEGAVREWVGMNTDITDRKAAEAALRQAKADAEKSDQAKSQFLSMLSHELRTPLTAVIGSSELLETGVMGPVTDEHREHLRRIKASAWHLVTIINEILTYTRSEAGKDRLHVSRSDIAEITRDVVAMLATEADARGLELRTLGADDPVHATTDRGKVRQVLTNLLGNALKFTREGHVEVELIEEADFIEMAVRDTGPGIPAASHEAVFEPFFQLDSSNTRTIGGTGLGLAVCRRLARALGGEILLESEPGAGSVFTFRMPRHVEEAPAEPDDPDGGRASAADAGAGAEAATGSRSH